MWRSSRRAPTSEWPWAASRGIPRSEWASKRRACRAEAAYSRPSTSASGSPARSVQSDPSSRGRRQAARRTPRPRDPGAVGGREDASLHLDLLVPGRLSARPRGAFGESDFLVEEIAESLHELDARGRGAGERAPVSPRETQGEFSHEVGRGLEEAAVARAGEARNGSRGRARNFAGAEIILERVLLFRFPRHQRASGRVKRTVSRPSSTFAPVGEKPASMRGTGMWWRTFPIRTTRSSEAIARSTSCLSTNGRSSVGTYVPFFFA